MFPLCIDFKVIKGHRKFLSLIQGKSTEERTLKFTKWLIKMSASWDLQDKSTTLNVFCFLLTLSKKIDAMRISKRFDTSANQQMAQKVLFSTVLAFDEKRRLIPLCLWLAISYKIFQHVLPMRQTPASANESVRHVHRGHYVLLHIKCPVSFLATSHHHLIVENTMFAI